MSSNLEKYGTNLHSNGFLIIPTSALDTPIYDALNPLAFPHYLVYDESEVITGGRSINEYLLINPNRKVIYTADGLYCYWGLMIPLSKDGQASLELIMDDADLILGEEFTDPETNKYWIANELELKEWLSVTPHEIIIP